MILKFKILRFRRFITLALLMFGVFLGGYNISISLGILAIGITFHFLTERHMAITEYEFEFYDKTTGGIIENKIITPNKAYHYTQYTGYSGRLIIKKEVENNVNNDK